MTSTWAAMLKFTCMCRSHITALAICSGGHSNMRLYKTDIWLTWLLCYHDNPHSSALHNAVPWRQVAVASDVVVWQTDTISPQARKHVRYWKSEQSQAHAQAQALQTGRWKVEHLKDTSMTLCSKWKDPVETWEIKKS